MEKYKELEQIVKHIRELLEQVTDENNAEIYISRPDAEEAEMTERSSEEVWGEIKEKEKLIPELIIDVAKEGTIDKHEKDKMISAVSSARRVQEIKDQYPEIIAAIKDNFKQKPQIKAWTHVLSRVGTTEMERRELISAATEGHFHYYCEMLKALEEEMDNKCESTIADWYVSLLELNLPESAQEKVFNRLAYYYLLVPDIGGKAFDKARSYFLALERHGMTIKNPFGGWYGEQNWEDLVDAVIRDDPEKDPRIQYLNMAEKLIQKYSVEGTYNKVVIHPNSEWYEYGIETDDKNVNALINIKRYIDQRIVGLYKFPSIEENLNESLFEKYEEFVVVFLKAIRTGRHDDEKKDFAIRAVLSSLQFNKLWN